MHIIFVFVRNLHWLFASQQKDRPMPALLCKPTIKMKFSWHGRDTYYFWKICSRIFSDRDTTGNSTLTNTNNTAKLIEGGHKSHSAHLYWRELTNLGKTIWKDFKANCTATTPATRNADQHQSLEPTFGNQTTSWKSAEYISSLAFDLTMKNEMSFVFYWLFFFPKKQIRSQWQVW